MTDVVGPKSETKTKSGRVRSGQARMSLLSHEERTKLAKTAAIARWSAYKAAIHMTKKTSKIRSISALQPATPAQGVLDLGIERQIEVDGVGMGVLSDGTPFLTGRGLSRLCGVAHRAIQDLSAEWGDTTPKSRVANIKEILLLHGISVEKPYLAISQRSGTFFAYPDAVCLAVLEYYAFDAGSNVKEQAKKNFRILAGQALRDFIYTQVGYDPNKNVPDVWRQFHDRVSLTYNSVPNGFFGIFKEMADMIVTLGQAGLHIDKSFVPDISVGISWAKYWGEMGLEGKHGQRIKFEHNYPDYFPQAKSNPQEPWCYPDSALGEFRRWLREIYIGEGKFKKYINQKVQSKELPASFAQLAVAAYGDDMDQ